MLLGWLFDGDQGNEGGGCATAFVLVDLSFFSRFISLDLDDLPSFQQTTLIFSFENFTLT